jgi:hypothetical protein
MYAVTGGAFSGRDNKKTAEPLTIADGASMNLLTAAASTSPDASTAQAVRAPCWAVAAGAGQR